MFLWVLTTILLVWAWWNPGALLDQHKPAYGNSIEANCRDATTAVVVLLFLVSIIWTGIVHASAADIRNSQYVVEARTAQRDELLEAFDDVLDSDEFVQLMEAATPEDLLFLRSNPEVTGFLLGRADRIVEVNKTLYEEQNDLLGKARSVCNQTQNPFVPLMPFMKPKCSLGTLEESFTQ